MIPKIIWQTYKTPFEELPQYAKDCIKTWKDLNPGYKYMYMSDDDIKNFILHEFDEEWLEIFNSYPLGVMRGDLFRYMIVYIYGGIYADIDTICKQPIDNWINKNNDLIIAMDDDNIYYAQLAFAAKPKNPTLKIVLDLVKEQSKKQEYNDIFFVHNTTGTYIWTHGIDIGISRGHSICCYKDPKTFEDGFIKHLVASKNWDIDYVQWQKEQEKYLGEKNA